MGIMSSPRTMEMTRFLPLVAMTPFSAEPGMTLSIRVRVTILQTVVMVMIRLSAGMKPMRSLAVSEMIACTVMVAMTH